MEKETKITRVNGDVNAKCADRMQTANGEPVLKQFIVRICFEFWFVKYKAQNANNLLSMVHVE